MGVAVGAGGERPGAAALHRGHPDLAASEVVRKRGVRHDERHEPAVGRNLGVRHLVDLEEVVQLHEPGMGASAGLRGNRGKAHQSKRGKARGSPKYGSDCHGERSDDDGRPPAVQNPTGCNGPAP